MQIVGFPMRWLISELFFSCINLYVGNIKEEKGPNYYSELLKRKSVSSGPDPSIKQVHFNLFTTGFVTAQF